MQHWFGTDDLGRDTFARVWQAGRVSLLIGITGALVASSTEVSMEVSQHILEELWTIS